MAEHRGPKPRHKVALTAPEYRELQRLTRRRTAPYAEVVRAKILLLAYEHPDSSNAAIARAVGCTDRTVRKWRGRSRAGPALPGRPLELRPAEAEEHGNRFRWTSPIGSYPRAGGFRGTLLSGSTRDLVGSGQRRPGVTAGLVGALGGFLGGATDLGHSCLQDGEPRLRLTELGLQPLESVLHFSDLVLGLGDLFADIRPRRDATAHRKEYAEQNRPETHQPPPRPILPPGVPGPKLFDDNQAARPLVTWVGRRVAVGIVVSTGAGPGGHQAVAVAPPLLPGRCRSSHRPAT